MKSIDSPLPINRSEIWSGNFLTYRRYLLDHLLGASSHLMRGTVVDLGGKRTRKRGAFRAPVKGVKDWIHVNLDAGTEPELVADVCRVPLGDESADCVVCTETIEHVSNPQVAIDECFRLLRPGGVLIVSVPFLYPVHADPFDFQRFTSVGLRNLCRRFSSFEVQSMGDFWGVIGMFLEAQASGMRSRVGRGILWRLGRWLTWREVRGGTALTEGAIYTTGYFAICRK